jgi:type IV pilus assembly protein PilB
VTVDGRELDVRVATSATIWGEKAVLRLLDKTRSLLNIARLGMAADTSTEFSKLIRSPFGMVICVGPTGSGKTTTLYAALTEIYDPSRNITTIEDPVEYVLPSINQIQINEQAGITFAGGLKSILRQDPDIILVGEIRDVETARVAVQSALTGHFVLSSLHATDATAGLHRFIDMGIESFLIASSVIALVAQRLVRRICSACKEQYTPTADEIALYERWGGTPKSAFWHGAGCNFCAQTGYSERVGVYELLRISEEIRELVVKQASQDELQARAKYEGMRTLRDEGLRLIEQDVTTIAEILRTIYVA